MTQLKTDKFYQTEARPIFGKVEGPINAFMVKDERKIQDHAVETGEIEAGAFRDCDVFGEAPDAIAQKTLRYETKRALEIMAILDEHLDEPSVEDHLASLYAQQIMARAVLVEAARKYGNEQAAGTLTPAHEELYRFSIDSSQHELFPQPDHAVAEYAMWRIYGEMQATNPEQASQFSEEYPFFAAERDPRNDILLSPEKQEEWHIALHEKYDPVFERTREQLGDTPFENASLAHAVEIFMKENGFPMKDKGNEGWEVVSNDKVAGFRVEPMSRQIICGRRKAEITWPVFERLMIHEVGVHATRAENGHRLGYEAVQSGLPGYQEVEEGLGLLLENIWAGKEIDPVGRDHYRYLAVCYADGQLDGAQHTEEETLQFISRMTASTKVDGLESETVLAAARKSGFEHVKRAFRGMPHGVIMYSNLAYLAGKLRMATFINHSDIPAVELLGYLQHGKTNPVDETHVSLMQQAGEPRDGWL